MGIDARILVRYKSEQRPTDEQLAEWSFRLCETFGANNFIMEDLPLSREAGLKDSSLLFPKIRRFAFDLSEDGKIYYQDGDPITAEPEEWLLEVNLVGRYYNIGYTRGDIILYISIAEWLEINVPDIEIWYGGDSSGVCAEPFTLKLRNLLKTHFFSPQSRSYFRPHEFQENRPYPPKCNLCPPGLDRRMQCGYNEGYSKYHCRGCGKSFESRDKGATWSITKP